MPIAPAFNPETGASGGGSPAASASLANLTPTAIDLTDESWTLYDPDSLVKSVAFTGGANLVTWNELDTGSADYNWSSGTTHRAPRWYRLLTISGVQVKSTHTLNMTTEIIGDVSVNDFAQQVVVGAAFDPSSTAHTTIDGSGGIYNKTTGGNPAYGTWQLNSATTGQNANNVRGITNVMRSNNAMGSGTYFSITSAGAVQTSGSRNSNQNAAAGSEINVFVMVGIGTASNSITVAEDDQQKFKASFNAITITFGV